MRLLGELLLQTEALRGQDEIAGLLVTEGFFGEKTGWQDLDGLTRTLEDLIGCREVVVDFQLPHCIVSVPCQCY